MRLSNANLEVLRSQPQSTRLWLSIFEPQAIFKAQINDASITRGARTITFNNVTLGAFTAIENGFSMWVGSTPGAQDRGKVRVRSATSTTVVVSENSNVDWADDLYITVFRYVELWPVYPRIIQDPADVENTIWYKDYDIAYTNQNSILGTYVNMGPHRAAKRDPASGLTQVYYSSTGSYNLLGTSLSYYWFFEGATVTGSNSADPGFITYNQSGNFTTRLIISGSNGSADTSYRYVTIDPPEYRWQLTSLNGSRGEGGYTASLKVFDTIPIQEHAVVVIFKESYYGNTVSNLGGNFPNASSIFFVGYIDKDSIQYDYEHSEVSFDALSVTGLMKQSSGFSVSVESKASPAYWYELLDMDGRRALYHYLRWHTTAMMFSDFQFVGDDYKIQFFDSDRESMYDAVNNYMRDTLIGQTVSDRQGKVWMEVEAKAYTNPTGSFPPVMDITRRDWLNQPTIEERLSEDMAFLEYGGVAYSGVVTGTFAALIGSAPGTTPGFHGGMETHEGLALLGQEQLNTLVGNVFANENSPFPSVNMDMSVNATNLDIAPQETVGVHIAREDTVRNLAIDGLYIPDSMSWRYNPVHFTLLPQIDLNQLVNGDGGETIIIPVDPSDAIGGGFNVPSLQIPPLPSLVNPPQGIGCCDEVQNNAKCCTVRRSSLEWPADTFPVGTTVVVLKNGEVDSSSNFQMYAPGTSNHYIDVSNVFGSSGTYQVSATFNYADASIPSANDISNNRIIWGARILCDTGSPSPAAEFFLRSTQAGAAGSVSLTTTTLLCGGANGFFLDIDNTSGLSFQGDIDFVLTSIIITACFLHY